MSVRFFDDKQIADILSLSRSWVRKQRWLRRHGHPHVLTLDPVMIGSVPRYCVEDVEAWLLSLRVANDNEPGLVVNGGGT